MAGHVKELEGHLAAWQTFRIILYWTILRHPAGFVSAKLVQQEH
jgi:hypothetical protein